MSANKYTSARAKLQIGRILAHLAERPMTRAELCQAIHMTTQGVCGYLQFLMGEPKRIHIKEFAPKVARGRRAPMYVIGAAKDAVEPPRTTDAEYYREMKRGDPERYRDHLARHSAIARAKRREKYPQTWLSALMPVSAGKSGATGKPANQNKT